MDRIPAFRVPFPPPDGGRVGTTGPQKWFFLRGPKSMQDENNSRAKSSDGDKHETVCPICEINHFGPTCPRCGHHNRYDPVAARTRRKLNLLMHGCYRPHN